MYNRLSTRQIYLSSDRNIMRDSSRLNKLNSQLSSGKKVENPSDDPVSKRKIMHQNKVLQEADSYLKNGDTALNQLENAETALRSIHDIVDGIKVLALQMANDTVSEDDRLQARQQVLHAVQDIISDTNTEIDGFYIFGGYRTSQPPFDQTGTYQGDTNARTLELAPSITKQVAFPGSEIVGGSGADLFQVLTDLADNLLYNDSEAIRDDRVGELDGVINHLSYLQSQSGTLQQEVEITKTVVETNILQSQLRKSDLEDIDITSAITEFSTIKTALETAMATTSQVMELSLLKYLS